MRGSAARGEYYRFSNSLKDIEDLKKKAEHALKCIEDYGMLTEEQLRKLKGTPEEQELLRKVSECPTAVVITGQEAYGELAVLTRLIEESMFPIVEVHKRADKINLRPIKVRYAKEGQDHNTVYFPVKESTVKGGPFHLAESKLETRYLTMNHLQLTKEDMQKPNLPLSYLEVAHHNTSLKDIVMIAVAPIRAEKLPHEEDALLQYKFITEIMETLFPVVIYAITRDVFTGEELDNLRELKKNYPDVNILFIKVTTPADAFKDHCPDHDDCLYKHGLLSIRQKGHTSSVIAEHTETNYFEDDDSYKPEYGNKLQARNGKPEKRYNMSSKLHRTLCDNLGYLTGLKPPLKLYKRIVKGHLQTHSDFIQDLQHFDEIKPYLRLLFDGMLYLAVKRLHRTFRRSMRMCILYAFDKAREIQITPKRIQYAKEKESELYEDLVQMAIQKQDEIRTAIRECMESMTPDLLMQAAEYEFTSVELPDNLDEVTLKNIMMCSQEIQEMVVGASNEAVTRQLATRIDFMKQSYIGTLQRCLENLENDCRASGEGPCIVNALKKMMNAAHQVEMTVSSSSSLLRIFWQKMKYLMTVFPGRTLPTIDAEWKTNVAQETINELMEARLAKSVCTQLKEQLKLNHEEFLDCMRQLEVQIASQLEHSGEQQERMKKDDAPRIAFDHFEVVSAADKLLYGIPSFGKELGRGQYGVVYGCKNWGGRGPCAVKSIVPVDDKHWKELALEYHYTMSIPEHDRIVTLRGCMIDSNYGQGDSIAAYLVMDKYPRDLHMGIKTGLEWKQRLQISIDVTQGIRFLHSQGLIHRDIKLKNVLLDKENRGKLTDLGFCKPEAMISGSVVGTPIHMAPEMFAGHYDNSVDVYAFAILYWYICAGSVKLPQAYQQIPSQEKLWNGVRKGLRPERLDTFCDRSWNLMQSCWEADPAKRPLLGCVEPQLEKLMVRLEEHLNSTPDQIESQFSALVEKSNVNLCTTLDLDLLTCKDDFAHDPHVQSPPKPENGIDIRDTLEPK